MGDMLRSERMLQVAYSKLMAAVQWIRFRVDRFSGARL